MKPLDFNNISKAFQLVKNQWQAFVGAGVIGVLAITISTWMAVPLLIAIGLLGGNRSVTPFLMLPVLAIVFVVVFTLTTVFQAGMISMGLKAYDGETVQFSDVFVPLKNPVPHLILGLIIGIGTAIAAIFCYFPALIFAGLTMFAIPNVLEKKLSPVDAITDSINRLKSQWFMATVFFLVVGLVGSIGIYACYVGWFFTFPIAMVTIALTYRDN